jgi:hypothetical protein
MAQRMESVAAPGGVMLSASTARLVEGAAALGEPQLVRIKGADEPVAARRLLGMGDQHRAIGRAESKLVGRRWEMSAVEGLLERAVAGQGAVVAADLLAARPELTSTLITHRFPIEDAVEAFRLAQDKSKGVFRVVVEPS